MKVVLVFAIALFTNVSLYAQFPHDWVGDWAGELEIYNAKGLQQKIRMALSIHPSDAPDLYSWELVYGEGEMKQVRPYALQIIDGKLGHYRVDERNTILLDAYLLGGVLVEIFSINGSMLIVTTEKIEEDALLWQIVVGELEPIATTGGREFEGEDIPEVASYRAPVLQRARLYRP